ncbi:MAG: SDR family oxidoreductase [Microthrixaceae bacterium]|jgi:NAD(P)-dependent dehydrogenase (short-subunit alcohol dehydrogenase family)|nr:SDR family oxidoreductase [Microthrixaceae bacterium]
MTDTDHHIAPTSPADLFSVAGKTVVVTGGTSGIGKMIAAGFVAGGAEVIVASRKPDACQATVDDLSRFGTISAIPANLSTEDGCRTFAESVAASHPEVHVLVNNAGATWGAPLDQHDASSWNRVLDLNVQGVFHTTRYLLPQLRAAARPEDPARVINVGSIDGIHVPILETYSYSSSKAAVHQLTRHLAKHLAPEVTVNAVAPGPFPSKMMRATLEVAGDAIAAGTALKRIGRDDDMAGVALFLASRAGSYLTGTVIPVDGGMATTK